MPYIKKEERKKFKQDILQYFYDLMSKEKIFPTPGNLNYLLTEICLLYLGENGESYKTYNDIIGVLECCKQELYRRKIIPYEDKKIKENGDVY